MNWKDYEYFYKHVIHKYVQDIQGIDKSQKKPCLIYRSKKANKIYHYYEQKRLTIRRYFMQLETHPMDRHKIAAVMIYAILKSRPFKVNDTIPDLPNQLLMANEYLAFYVALSIIESYKQDECLSLGVNEADILENQSKWKLSLPRTYHGNIEMRGEEYIDNTCKALYYLRNPERFDVFAYSNILFLLEKYSDTINHIDPTPIDME